MKELTLFEKIINGEIPCTKIYEDEHTFSFLDISPINKGHTLVIPKKPFPNIFMLPDKELTALFLTVQKVSQAVMKATGATGINIGMNNGAAAGQVIFHAHVHIIPRFSNDGLEAWPGQRYNSGEIEQFGEQIRKALGKESLKK